MLAMIFDKMKTINTWHFLWIGIIISEVFTAIMNSILSIIWWDTVSIDLLMIGSIDAFVVAFLVITIFIYFVNQIRLAEITNLKLTQEIEERKRAEQALNTSREELELRVKDRTAELANANIELIQEIAERTEIEKELRDSEEKYSSLVNEIKDGFFIIDKKGKLLFANNALAMILNKERGTDLYGFDGIDLIHPHYRDYYQEILLQANEKGEFPTDLEVPIKQANGNTGYIALSVTNIYDKEGDLTGARGIAVDITEKKQREKELLDSQKMEAIGVLSAGIAHDFNNILNIIYGLLQRAKHSIDNKNKTLDVLDNIFLAAQRASGLIKQIMAFNRKAKLELQNVQLDDVVEESIMFFTKSTNTIVEIRSSIPPHCWPIKGDRIQIQQVIMNLVNNAIWAMSNTPEPILEITLDCVERDSDISMTPFLSKNKYVKFTIKDNGVGIDLDTQDKIFDPYYTSKQGDDGTGLGLAITKGILNAHEAPIDISSRPGQGTTFTILFPSDGIQKTEDEAALCQPESSIAIGRILFIDDEKAIVENWKICLERLGFEVFGYSSGLNAIDFFRKNPDGVDVIVTDHKMPDISGITLAEEMRKARPDIPIILITGWEEDDLHERAAKLGIYKIISKPHDFETLQEALANCMSEPS